MKKAQKLKGNRQNLIIFLSFLLFTFYLSLGLTSVYALDSSPSADLQSKLKALQTEIASKAAQMKQEVSQKLQNKAYVGFLKSKSTSSLTVATEDGTEIVNINQFTNFSDRTTGTRSVTLKNLAVDDYLAALGDIDDNGVLTAKKIVAYDAPKPVERATVFGRVTSFDPADGTVAIQTPDNHTQSFSWDNDTVFKLGAEDGNISDIKVGKNIIVVGVTEQSGSQWARSIVIIPDSATPTKLASPSAQTSPSATTSKNH